MKTPGANDILRAHGLDALREAIDDPATDLSVDDIGATGSGETETGETGNGAGPEPSAAFDSPETDTDPRAEDHNGAGEPHDAGQSEQEPAPAPLTFLDPAQWQGQEIPPRRWLVPYRIPLGNVTMLNGDGAAGKTTIALQLGAATVRGSGWLGSIIDTPGPALFMTAEEDRDEIHRRLAAIVDHQGIGFGDLTGLRLL